MLGEIVKPFFHITTRSAWNHSQAAREYRAPSLDTEGFIHLSTEEQWRHTLHRLFRGVADLVVLRIDPQRVDAEIKLERADGDVGPVSLALIHQKMCDFTSRVWACKRNGLIPVGPRFHATGRDFLL